MSDHRRYSRRRSSESSSSRKRSRSNSRSSMQASTTETDDDVPGGHRRFNKRPSASLPMRSSPASPHSWVLLNRTGARRDDFPGDRTTFAMSRTSKGEEISVSFELVEPPDTSFLTADLPPAASRTTSTIIAAHRDVVLLAITSSYENTYPPYRVSVVDLFIYQTSRLPSLLLLPSEGGPVLYSHHMGMGTQGLGIMSCTSNDDDSSPPFVVAYLEISAGTATIDARLFRSWSGQWEIFKNLHVHNDANGHRDLLCCWSTDAVVRYGRRYMIWVDYYRGMVIMDLSPPLEPATTNPPPPPRLRYVPLPVDMVEDPEDPEFGGRGYPKASRRVCVTRYGIKFVSVDRQHWSNFGIGNRHVLTWSHRFRITTWSLREDDYTWRNDATMHEEKFWDAFDGGNRRFRFRFPHVEPQFPVVDVDNPDVVVFRLEDGGQKWMIEVDLRKKVLLAATDYSRKENESGFHDPIPSELPRYVPGYDGQACKKRGGNDIS